MGEANAVLMPTSANAVMSSSTVTALKATVAFYPSLTFP